MVRPNGCKYDHPDRCDSALGSGAARLRLMSRKCPCIGYQQALLSTDKGRVQSSRYSPDLALLADLSW